jgi:hypothetical protein
VSSALRANECKVDLRRLAVESLALEETEFHYGGERLAWQRFPILLSNEVHAPGEFDGRRSLDKKRRVPPALFVRVGIDLVAVRD